MKAIMEIYNNYLDVGISTRKITEGKEYDLVKKFIDFRKNSFYPTDNNYLAIFIESKVNNSYPDIVFVEYDPNNYVNWQNTRNELLSSDLKILYHIFISKNIDATSIVSQLGVSWKEALLSIEKLYDSKLISRKNNGWCIRNKNSISLKRIEAVEAKLEKLDDVFQQALINKNFASESYILSIRKNRLLKNRLDLFNKFGIGIYMQDRNGFQVLNQSKKSSIPVGFYSIYFNEWVGRILNKNNKGFVN
ncbi:MAG: hypothetical protein GX660_28650 [Clostridiaceae bacterium]|nr:hypothetical protein [Clostridiaceae bacterium]